MGLFDAASLPSGPTSQQITTGAINTWAQPYVNNMLSSAQNLVNQNAGPNALMNQSYSGAQNLQLPGQFGQGTQAAGQGISQALGAGQNYANMATDPNSVAAYMNPYIQQSLAPQLALLNQQQQLQNQNINAQAVGQGAFGGNRATLAQGLNAQNFDLARQQAIGQGYNTAFNAAQQAQQYGAGLGLQGAQSAIQGAQTLGQLGSAQNQANLGILGLQNQFGQQQYNLPYQNLQFMQGMMQGLPVASQTQQGWQAPPNKLSQMTGLTGSLVTGAALANKLGMFDNIKNPFSSRSSIGSGGADSNIPYGGDARDIGENVTELSGKSYGDLPSDIIGNDSGSWDDWDYNIGGSVQSYASGGIVSLALDKAAKGKK